MKYYELCKFYLWNQLFTWKYFDGQYVNANINYLEAVLLPYAYMLLIFHTWINIQIILKKLPRHCINEFLEKWIKQWLDKLNIIGWKHSVRSIRSKTLPPSFVNLFDVCDDIIRIKRNLCVISCWRKKKRKFSDWFHIPLESVCRYKDCNGIFNILIREINHHKGL